MIALSEIRGLSLQEKLRTMEVLWEDISPQEAGLEVPLWHKDLLDERERLVAEGKAGFIDWEEAKQQIRDSVS